MSAFRALPHWTLYAIGRPMPDGVEQVYYTMPLAPDLRAAWDAARHGIAFDQWAEVLVRQHLIDRPADAFDSYLQFRACHLLTEFPWVYTQIPGPTDATAALVFDSADAVPLTWPNHAVWFAGLSLAELLTRLDPHARWDDPSILSAFQTVLRHPNTHLLSLGRIAPTLGDRV